MARVSFPEPGRAVVTSAGDDLALLGDTGPADLRWYLEDYPQVPFGEYAERGRRIAAELTGWGRRMFAAAFGDVPDAYRTWRMTQAPVMELRSSHPAWLRLPWELITDPARPTPLALDGVRFTRVLDTPDDIPGFAVTGKRPRVLMMISRPSGARDVAFRAIARPMLAAVDNDTVEVVVVRPPTLDGLADALAAASEQGRPFQVVHLDCHGELGDEAMLLFEKPGVGAERVRASQVARVLADARVPVVVLNACQSGAVGAALETAIATRLIADGVVAVVAMAYTVYAVAATHFMTAFYANLFAGGSVSDAVVAGRARMSRHPDRPGPTGHIPLQDWLIPVHYARADVRFPRFASPVARPAVRDPLAGVGTFVGRDHEFHQLEASIAACPVTLLHGPAGTGKSELAKAFGRWWRDTGGVRAPEHVVWHTFDPGLPAFGAAAVVAGIGMSVLGQPFAAADETRRRTMVRDLLHRERLLLVWDNVEALDDDDLAAIAGFLGDLGASAVLMTSRTPESRLGELRRIELTGLSPEESSAYTDDLLAPYPNALPRRAAPAFAELLRWLDGHPLTMRLVLPHLDNTDADVLLAGLRGTTPLPTGYGTGRTGSLAASLAYSTARLTPRTRGLLAATALCHAVADADVLALLSEESGAPERFRATPHEQWSAALEEAARAGLLVEVGGAVYRLHPALPAHFRDQWQADAADEGADFDAELCAARHSFVYAMTRLAAWTYTQIVSGNAEIGTAVAELHTANLTHALREALDEGWWQAAGHLGLLLHSEWTRTGRTEELRRWTDRVQLAVEDDEGNPPRTTEQGSSLWLLFVTAELTASPLADFATAESTYHKAHALLLDQPDDERRRRQSAVVASQLGRVYMQTGRLAEARAWLDQALTAARDLGYRQGVAAICLGFGDLALAEGQWDAADRWYEQSRAECEAVKDQGGTATARQKLGWVAWMRRRWDDAERHYRVALGTLRALQDVPGQAAVTLALGEVAHYRGDLDTAERLYRDALVTREKLGDAVGAARIDYLLGELAHLRERWDEAEGWLLRSLPAFTAIADRSSLGTTHHALGRLAEARSRYAEAESWYRQALADFEEAGNRPGTATSHGALGSLAQRQGDLPAALEHVVRCVTQFDDFPNPGTGPGADHLRRLTAALGLDALTHTWTAVTGRELPDSVRTYVTRSTTRA
ncbi:tetratricopeptide repeat protein [Streptomyces wuyuanensis]|uniref:ATP-, maltotriose-and DNA-dependent transcriptional regulator MalT n=1 Tax=Streptomyces wuyuanensis TaxID=1196353 RepID=A0A1G9YLF6_9ACTN|nr:tetratricopeptide repeat protein [Streptomyces wuyuanensis]SDN10049.1 ATP-, maltotriose-and DNA-dependent transcriptional regulator MalT [Streptomyces wuyuanensis]